MSGEEDPLVTRESSVSYGSDPISIHHNRNERSSIRESRRFEPLLERLKDVVRVYWHLGLVAFGG